MFHYFSDLSHRPEKKVKQTHKSTNATTCTTRTPNLMWTMQRYIIPAFVETHAARKHNTHDTKCLHPQVEKFMANNKLHLIMQFAGTPNVYLLPFSSLHSLSVSLSHFHSAVFVVKKKKRVEKKTAFHRYLVYVDSFSRWCLQRFVLFYIQADYYFAE